MIEIFITISITIYLHFFVTNNNYFDVLLVSVLAFFVLQEHNMSMIAGFSFFTRIQVVVCSTLDRSLDADRRFMQGCIKMIKFVLPMSNIIEHYFFSFDNFERFQCVIQSH